MLVQKLILNFVIICTCSYYKAYTYLCVDRMQHALKSWWMKILMNNIIEHRITLWPCIQRGQTPRLYKWSEYTVEPQKSWFSIKGISGRNKLLQQPRGLYQHLYCSELPSLNTSPALENCKLGSTDGQNEGSCCCVSLRVGGSISC